MKKNIETLSNILKKTYPSDLNEISQTCISGCSSQTKNKPVEGWYGQCITMLWEDSIAGVQVFFTVVPAMMKDTDKVFIRRKADNLWEDWTQLH